MKDSWPIRDYLDTYSCGKYENIVMCYQFFFIFAIWVSRCLSELSNMCTDSIFEIQNCNSPFICTTDYIYGMPREIPYMRYSTVLLYLPNNSINIPLNNLTHISGNSFNTYLWLGLVWISKFFRSYVKLNNQLIVGENCFWYNNFPCNWSKKRNLSRETFYWEVMVKHFSIYVFYRS